MHSKEFNKKQVIIYLLWTFASAYIIQFADASLYTRNRQAGQMVLAAMMFVPALGVFFSGAGFSGMGWKPQIRKNVKIILAAWFGPLLLTAAGALIYFLLFPRHFDLNGGYMAVLAGEEAMKQMKAQGISYPLYVVISTVGCVTYAPLINMFAALGEEIGWRGFLYPQLEAGFGRRKGWLLGGFIWGAWHWPLIWLIGYEYGAAAGNPAGYAGFPLSGMLIFGIFTAGFGVLHAWLYEKSGTIWVPSILHGAFNGAAALPLMLCLANTGSFRLLGPAPNGIISVLPIMAAAAVLLLREDKRQSM